MARKPTKKSKKSSRKSGGKSSRSKIVRKDTGPRMSQLVVHGDKAYLAGMVAAKPVPSVLKQTEQILKQIDKYLRMAGTDKSRILKANIWLTDMSTFGEMNQAWEAWAPKGNTPARATVESRLATPDYLVEIMVEAAI
jgi:enamine deaminase RidA (YjgF/YER057c/UK114 family)